MNVTGLLFLLLMHYLSGRGLLGLFKINLRPVVMFCLSMICGVALLSLPPFALQLFHIPITYTSVLVSICVLTLPLLIPFMRTFKKPDFSKIKLPALYEYPYIAVYLVFILVSVWKCFYFPSYARDMLSGPELMAEYAVKEKTMINSMFSIDLHTTNNYLKPPFITSLQIIYKLFVGEFGQLWLSVLFVSFITWLYNIMREKLHPLIGGLLILLFLAIPETYAYTFMLLFDYSNMIFFFAGFYFLARYAENKSVYEFAFSVFLFAIATYIRTETLVLIGMIVPLLAYYFYKEKTLLIKSLLRIGAFLAVPYFFYFICIDVFVKYQIPIHFDVSGEVNKHLGDLGPLFSRFSDINSMLIFSQMGENLYGYFFYLFIIVLAADLIFFRKSFSTEAVVALYGVIVVYLGLPFLGYLLPLVDLRNTTKRGFFKIFPLMMLYMRNSGLLLKLSGFINNWEFANNDSPKKPQLATVKTAAAKKPQVVNVKKK